MKKKDKRLKITDEDYAQFWEYVYLYLAAYSGLWSTLVAVHGHRAFYELFWRVTGPHSGSVVLVSECINCPSNSLALYSYLNDDQVFAAFKQIVKDVLQEL